MTRTIALALGCLVLAAAPAVAQAPPKPATAAAPTPEGCPARSATVVPPGTATTPGTTTATSQEPLGDKLARSDGVLCPPTGLDPEIRAPTPDVGKTPVIPPPGSPGGDPSIRPK